MTQGPDFIGLQTDDVEALARFYESALELKRSKTSPPGAVVFDTTPIPFAIRTPLVDLSGNSVPGAGVTLWLHCDDAPALHKTLTDRGVEIHAELAPSPFGMHFAFKDPAGYIITVHDKP